MDTPKSQNRPRATTSRAAPKRAGPSSVLIFGLFSIADPPIALNGNTATTVLGQSGTLLAPTVPGTGGTINVKAPKSAVSFQVEIVPVAAGQPKTYRVAATDVSKLDANPFELGGNDINGQSRKVWSYWFTPKTLLHDALVARVEQFAIGDVWQDDQGDDEIQISFCFRGVYPTSLAIDGAEDFPDLWHRDYVKLRPGVTGDGEPIWRANTALRMDADTPFYTGGFIEAIHYILPRGLTRVSLEIRPAQSTIDIAYVERSLTAPGNLPWAQPIYCDPSIQEAGNPDYFQAPVTALVITPNHWFGSAVNGRFRRPPPAQVSVIEDIPRCLATAALGAATGLASLRILSMTFLTVVKPLQLAVDWTGPPLSAPLGEGNTFASVTGEIEHLNLGDRSNYAARLYGDQIGLAQIVPQFGQNQHYLWGVAFPSRNRLAALPPAAMPPAPFKISEPAGIERALMFGDLNLVVAAGAPVNFATAGYAGVADAAFAPDTWRFPISAVRKAPLQGDALLASVSLPLPAGSLPSVTCAALSPCLEIYLPRTDSKVLVAFTGAGELCKPATDLLAGFAIPPSGDLVRVNQPGNSYLQIGSGTTLARPLCTTPRRHPRPPSRPPAYSALDLTLTLPAVVSEAQAETSLECPTFIWRESGLNPLLPDGAVRTTWSPLQSKTRYNAFAAANAETPLGFGWGVALSPATDATTALPYVAWETAHPSSPAAPFVCVKTPTQATMASASTPAAKIIIDLSGADNPFSEYWDDLFPPATAKAAPSPLNAGWTGVAILGGAAGLASLTTPSFALPPTVQAALEKIAYQFVWWDGEGAHAIVDYKAPIGQPAADFTLQTFQLVLHRSQVLHLDLNFTWRLPYFMGSGQFVSVNARIEPLKTGEESIVFHARILDPNLDPNTGNPSVSLGWMGLDRLEVAGITLSRIQKVRTAGTASTDFNWFISLDGGLVFDATNSTLKAWFETPPETLSFADMRFDFDRPIPPPDTNGSITFTFPNLRIVSRQKYYPSKFAFTIKAIELGMTDGPTNNRRLSLIGALDFAAAYAGYAGAKPGSDGPSTVPHRLTLKGAFAAAPVDTMAFEPPDGQTPGSATTAWWAPVFTQFGLGAVSQNTQWMPVTTTKSTNDPTPFFASKVALDWTWAPASGTPNADLRFGGLTADKYWVVQRTGTPELDLGPVVGQSAVIASGYRATLPTIQGQADFQTALNTADYEALRTYLLAADPSDWIYCATQDWFLCACIDTVQVPTTVPLVTLQKLALVLNDKGIQACTLGDVQILGTDTSDVSLVVDWANQLIGAKVKMTDLSFGDYEVDAGTVEVAFGKKEFLFNWGCPTDPNDWSGAATIRWEPPTYPIPINGVQGGIMVELLKDGRDPTVMVASALRLLFRKVLGSDGDHFGAFLAVEIGLGGILKLEVKTGGQPCYEIEGIVAFSATGTGGVIVFDHEWDILRVHVNDNIDLRLDTDFNGHSYLHFSNTFDAGFSVCLGCSCLSASVSFTVQAGMGKMPPNCGALLADALARNASVGHALLNALTAQDGRDA